MHVFELEFFTMFYVKERKTDIIEQLFIAIYLMVKQKTLSGKSTLTYFLHIMFFESSANFEVDVEIFLNCHSY